MSRINVASGAVERLVDLKQSPDHWSGLAPDNSPILLATGSTEVYALDLELTDGELDVLQRLLEKAGVGREHLSERDKALLPALPARWSGPT